MPAMERQGSRRDDNGDRYMREEPEQMWIEKKRVKWGLVFTIVGLFVTIGGGLYTSGTVQGELVNRVGEVEGDFKAHCSQYDWKILKEQFVLQEVAEIQWENIDGQLEDINFHLQEISRKLP